MAFTDQFTLSQDAVFQGRVKIAMAKAAVDIVGESQESKTTQTHRKRHQLGVAVLNDPDTYLDRFVLAVVTNAVITGASNDGDVEFTVASVFDDIAGVGENIGR